MDRQNKGLLFELWFGWSVKSGAAFSSCFFLLGRAGKEGLSKPGVASRFTVLLLVTGGGCLTWACSSSSVSVVSGERKACLNRALFRSHGKFGSGKGEKECHNQALLLELAWWLQPGGGGIVA